MNNEIEVFNAGPLTLSAQEVYDFVREKLAPVVAEEREKIGAVIQVTSQLKAVETAEEYEAAIKAIQALKGAVKRGQERLDDMKKKAHLVHKGFTGAANDMIVGTAEEENRLKKIAIAWKHEQDRKRREEEARLREEARKAEEEQRLKEALEAEARGDKEEAEAILSEETPEPAVVLPDTTPKVAGNAERTTWKFNVVNVALIPREYMMPDTVKIGAIVRAMKGNARIPGIEVYPEDTFATRAQ